MNFIIKLEKIHQLLSFMSAWLITCIQYIKENRFSAYYSVMLYDITDSSCAFGRQEFREFTIYHILCQIGQEILSVPNCFVELQ